MNFDDARDHATRALVSRAANLQPPALRGDRPQRRHRRPLLVGAAIAGVFVFIAVTTTLNSGEPRNLRPSATATTTTGTQLSKQEPPRWSIAYPSDWFRRDTVGLGPDSVMVQIATFPLTAETSQCLTVLGDDMLRVGATDTLISITVVGTYIGLSRDTATANDTIEAPLSPRPRSSAPINDFERARFDSGGCSTPDGLTTKRVQWVLNDNLVDVVLVTGDAVSASQWEQTWNIVSSLAAGAPEGDRTQGICISTAPPDPGFSAPEPYYADPFWEFDLWYGTADLWTILPRQGFEYGPRKSIWWSVEFAGWPTEPSPEIAVTWRRIDVLDGETIVSDHPGTNAFTPEDGLLMIAGIDPRINGCWEVTATYKGASLSYVYEKFQVRRETSTPKGTSP